MKKKIKKEVIFKKTWKKEDQKLCVIIFIDGKAYQVDLDKEKQASIAFLLPQLFDDHIIKICPEELPLTLDD